MKGIKLKFTLNHRTLLKSLNLLINALFAIIFSTSIQVNRKQCSIFSSVISISHSSIQFDLFIFILKIFPFVNVWSDAWLHKHYKPTVSTTGKPSCNFFFWTFLPFSSKHTLLQSHSLDSLHFSTHFPILPSSATWINGSMRN